MTMSDEQLWTVEHLRRLEGQEDLSPIPHDPGDVPVLGRVAVAAIQQECGSGWYGGRWPLRLEEALISVARSPERDWDQGVVQVAWLYRWVTQHTEELDQLRLVPIATAAPKAESEPQSEPAAAT